MDIKHFTTLKTTTEFNRVYNNSKTQHTQQFVLFYHYQAEEYKFGVVASKKVGKAVQRNLAKRLLRSHFINQIDNLKPGFYILVAKPSLLESEYQLIEKSFINTLKRLKALNS